eukprot:CCRYP_005486-RB/>CCRYP_005486-RB protein AED:0.32 eAED:0.32 QI:194/1/1/1/1/0.66/3/1177/595
MAQTAKMHRGLLRMVPPLFLSATSIYLIYRGNIVPTESNPQFDAYLDGGPPPYHHRGHFWDRNAETSCFRLDSICHRNDIWFYRRSGRETSHQPTITYVQENVTSSHGYIRVDPQIYFNVSASSVTPIDDDSCPIHPTPFHMIVQSAYNDMMGEFYSRSLVALNQLLQDNPIPGSYYSNLQMYLHVVEKKKHKLLEGHRLFLGGLPNNNKFDSFLSLLSNQTCNCFEKLVFCGYDIEKASKYKPANNSYTSGLMQMAPEYKNDDAKIFRPVGYVKSYKTLCSRKTAGKYDLKSKNCFSFRNLRRDIYKTYAQKDVQLPTKILEYRKHILIKKGFITDHNVTAAKVDEWTFIGFAMRKKRRVWLNIDESISLCDEKFRRKKVVCFTVDVEDAKSPEHQVCNSVSIFELEAYLALILVVIRSQLLMHRCLHALIGVHGAQLTQGVLLPPHGKILELLPWVPTYLQGNWVQWTNRPTPLGVIFHKADLNHFGYKLDRNSVPLCLNVSRSDTELERECFMSKEHLRKFQWATRDFNVPSVVVYNFISQFVLYKNVVCDDMRMRAEQNDFVLYNAYCLSDSSNSRFQVEHYFRETDDILS